MFFCPNLMMIHANRRYHALKLHSHFPKKNCVICFIESPFINDKKNVFYFILKALYILKIFVMTFWLCRKSGLIRKIRLTSKVMTSQHGLQTIGIHILPNISQSKGNQTTKFGQVIEYNKRNTFHQKLCAK